MDKNSVTSYVMDHDIYGWIYMVAILLVVSWMISTIGYALKHGNFTVNRKNDEVRISQGLLERKELVLKLHRIQGITIKEGILRQPFGYCAVQVEVIQSEGKRRKSYTASYHSKRSSATITRAFTITIRTECKYYFVTKSSIAPLSH